MNINNRCRHVSPSIGPLFPTPRITWTLRRPGQKPLGIYSVEFVEYSLERLPKVSVNPPRYWVVGTKVGEGWCIDTVSGFIRPTVRFFSAGEPVTGCTDPLDLLKENHDSTRWNPLTTTLISFWQQWDKSHRQQFKNEVVRRPFKDDFGTWGCYHENRYPSAVLTTKSHFYYYL